MGNRGGNTVDCLFIVMAKKVNRAINLPAVLIHLGIAVSVTDATGKVYKWPAKLKTGLFVSSAGSTIYCLQFVKKVVTGSYFKDVAADRMPEITAGLNLYEKWHEFDSDSGSLTTPPRGFLFDVGRAASIIYSSDKWTGKTRKYIHTFKTKPKLWVNRKKDPKLLVLSGGKIQTTGDGIKG